MGYTLKQSSAARPLLFLMLDSTDHVTPKTGLSPTVVIAKGLGDFAAPAGLVVERGNGWYQVAGSATDTNTIGPLLLHATATGADPVDDTFTVSAYDVDQIAAKTEQMFFEEIHPGLTCLMVVNDSGFSLPSEADVSDVYTLAFAIANKTAMLNFTGTGPWYAQVDVGLVSGVPQTGADLGAAAAAIHAKTDNLPADPASETATNALWELAGTLVVTDEDATGADPTGTYELSGNDDDGRPVWQISGMPWLLYWATTLERWVIGPDATDQNPTDCFASNPGNLIGQYYGQGAYGGHVQVASFLDAAVSSRSTLTAAGVWANSTRTLTGASQIVGPTAPRSDRDIQYKVFQGGTLPLCARVQKYTGVDLLRADVSAIEYSIFELSDHDPAARTAVAGHSEVDLVTADVLYDTLQSDTWASNYNFRLLPNTSTDDAFVEAGKRYLVEVKITPTSGPLIIVRFLVRCI